MDWARGPGAAPPGASWLGTQASRPRARPFLAMLPLAFLGSHRISALIAEGPSPGVPPPLGSAAHWGRQRTVVALRCSAPSCLTVLWGQTALLRAPQMRPWPHPPSPAPSHSSRAASLGDTVWAAEGQKRPWAVWVRGWRAGQGGPAPGTESPSVPRGPHTDPADGSGGRAA